MTLKIKDTIFFMTKLVFWTVLYNEKIRITWVFLRIKDPDTVFSRILIRETLKDRIRIRNTAINNPIFTFSLTPRSYDALKHGGDALRPVRRLRTAGCSWPAVGEIIYHRQQHRRWNLRAAAATCMVTIKPVII